jgi:hypothetical protein
VSSDPFDIDLVIARIKAQVPTFRNVRGSADYASIKQFSDFAPPEAFVLLARERGGESPGNSRQAVRVAFGVVIVARNYREQRGKPALDSARPLIGQVRDALIGWIPQDASSNKVSGGRGCQWSQGDVMDYDSATLLWSDIFTTQHFIGSQQ